MLNKNFIFIKIYGNIIAFLKTGYGHTVNILTFSYDSVDYYQEEMVDDFNEYAKEQNLDIQIHRTSLSMLNITNIANDYLSFIEKEFKKESTNYDLFVVDDIYTNQLNEYTSDLRKYVSKEIIDKYSSGITSKIGYIGEKLVALVSIYIII